MLLALVAVASVAVLSHRLARRRARRAALTDAADPQPRKRSTRDDTHRLGYRYADDRIFINGNGVYAGITMPTQTGEFATRHELGDLALTPVSLEQTLLAVFDRKPVHCHELLRYRPITTDGWAAQLLEQCWNPTAWYHTLLNRLAGYISQTTPQRLWCLIVRLGDAPADRTVDPTAPLADMVIGVAQERLTVEDLTPWWEVADRFHTAMAGHGAEPLSRRDLLFLIRKVGAGHLPVPDEPITHHRPWRDGWFELAAQLRGTNIGGGYLELHYRHPESGQDTRSYCATLVVADAPSRAVLNPHNPWAQRLSRLVNPPEISWRYTLFSSDDWKRTTDKAVENIEDEAKDRHKAGAPDDRRFRARLEQAQDITETADDPQPGMTGRLRLIVSAPTVKELAQAIVDAKRAMGQIQVEVPAHTAQALLHEHLPGEVAVDLGSLSAGPAGGIRLWQRHTDLYAPAVGMLGSHPQIGDRVVNERGRLLGWIGHFIGWVKANGSAVHNDPTAQLARGEGAGVGIFGSSGGGKTSYGLDQFFWMSESGVACYALDPKIDFANFIYYLAFGPQVLDPEFMNHADRGILGTPDSRFQPVNRQLWDETVIHDLARGPRGAQDPWRITDTFQDGYHLADTLIDVLFSNDTHRSIARQALRTLQAENKQATAAGVPFRCGLGDVATPLEAELRQLEADLDRARTMGGDTVALRRTINEVSEVLDRFVTGQDTPFLRQLLGRRDDPPEPPDRQARRTIYTLAGFKTPDHPDEPDLWSTEDRNAAAVMLAALNRIRRSTLHGRMQPNPVTGRMAIRPTATFVDEGYMVTALPVGRGYLVVTLRQGRSMRSTLFFMDQQARGIQAIEAEARRLGAAEVNQFGSIFTFRQKSLGEALNSLRLLRSVITDDDTDEKEREEAILAKKLLSEEAGGELRAGTCVMRDPDSRVATVVIDQVFAPLQRASQTNAVLKEADWSHPVPADPNDWDINPIGLLQVRRGLTTAVDDENTDEESDLEAFDLDPAPVLAR